MSHARVHTVHHTFKLSFFQMTLCNLWECLQCIEVLLSTSAVYQNVAVSKTDVTGLPQAGGQGRTDCLMIFNARLSSSFPSAMERQEDKNKENTLVNQGKSCKMQIAQSVLDKESVQHLSQLTNTQANILFVSLSLIYQAKMIFIYQVFCIFKK